MGGGRKEERGNKRGKQLLKFGPVIRLLVHHGVSGKTPNMPLATQCLNIISRYSTIISTLFYTLGQHFLKQELRLEPTALSTLNRALLLPPSFTYSSSVAGNITPAERADS